MQHNVIQEQIQECEGEYVDIKERLRDIWPFPFWDYCRRLEIRRIREAHGYKRVS